MSMLTDWTVEHSRRFQKEIMTFGHDLSSSGLFSDEALIALLRKHPSDQLDVCSMSDNADPRFPNEFLTGDFRNVEPEVLLDAAKAGRIWINVRKGMNLHPEYNELLSQMYGGIAERVGGKTYNANGGILISSPISQTPYHFDKTETILWHVRGGKRIYIYPLTEEFIADKDYEAIITNDLVDDLPYDKSFDDAAKVFDLQPGQAISWPLNSPHRVDNTSFCVSVTTEYSTRESAIKNANMIANAALRSKFGRSPNYANDGQFKRMAKMGLGVTLRRLGYVANSSEPDMVKFRIDPDAKGFVVPTEPFVRNF